MAPAKFERIISVSSEDPAFPAENLIKNSYSTDKKWKCKNAGEKQISLVLQLEKAERITAVDVGNYGSAFIEIFVSKSNSPDDFKVLIVASSLMTLNEAKLGTNLSSVRFFKEDSIDKSIASEKWDRVKIVCSQPYNKLIQYGLAFLVIHTASPPTTEKPAVTLGNFQLKNSASTPDITIGSLFAKRKEMGEAKGAAAIRVASKKGSEENKLSPKIGSRSKEASTTNRKDSTPQDLTALRNSSKDKNNAQTPKAKPRNILNGVSQESSPSSKKLKATPTAPRKPRSEKPFDKLFENVVFAISGFQNPFRGDLRSKALQMGAKYKADWDSSCTHLICAFPNTPKFNQVLGHGKIVKKGWIEDCYSRRMRLPWRRYALHPPDAKKPESEDEIFEFIERPPSPVDNRRRISPGRSPSPDTEEEVERVLERQRAIAAVNGTTPTKPDPSVELNGKDRESNEEVENDETSEDNKEKTSKEMVVNITLDTNKTVINDVLIKNKTKSPKLKDKMKKISMGDVKSESGTKNMNNRTPKDKPIVNNKRGAPDAKEKKSPVKKKPKVPKVFVGDAPEDTYDMDTEEEDEECDSKVFDLPFLPTFLEGVSFHISSELAEGDYNEVRRYILAHKGTIIQEDDLSYKDVKYLIALTMDEVNKLKAIKPEVIAVRPEWIWKAHDECRIPPTASFEVK